MTDHGLTDERVRKLRVEWLRGKGWRSVEDLDELIRTAAREAEEGMRVEVARLREDIAWVWREINATVKDAKRQRARAEQAERERDLVVDDYQDLGREFHEAEQRTRDLEEALEKADALPKWIPTCYRPMCYPGHSCEACGDIAAYRTARVATKEDSP